MSFGFFASSHKRRGVKTLGDLSGTFSLAESAAEDDDAGAIGGKKAGSTLSLIDDAGGRVALSGNRVVRGATALDYEADEEHSFTVRETLAGAVGSPKDTVLTLVVTNVAPDLSVAVAEATSDTGADILVSTTEASGDWYWYISTSPTAPVEADLKDGTGAVAFGSQAVSTPGVQTASVVGLPPNTVLYAHYLQTDGGGADSSIVTSDAFQTFIAAPGNISDLTATAQSDSAVLLEWTPSTSATSHQYRIDGGSWVNCDDNSGEQLVTGLTGSTEYDFQVRGVNGTGNGSASNTATETTDAAGALGSITDLTATAQSDTEVLLEWTPATNATSHEYRVDGGAWVLCDDNTGEQLVDGLTAGTEYDFEVRGLIDEELSDEEFSTAVGPVSGGAITAEANVIGWWSAQDLATLTVSNAGTTAVAADGDLVGKMFDKSASALDLVSPGNDSTRPVWHDSGGLKYITADGSNDILQRLGVTEAQLPIMLDASWTVAIAIKGNPSTGRHLFIMRGSDSGDPILCPLMSQTTTAANGAIFYRDDTGGVIATGSNQTANKLTNAWDNTLNVVIVVCNGSTITWYLDGTISAVGAVTVSEAGADFTESSYNLGLFANRGAASAGNWFACDFFEMAVWNKALDSGERAAETTRLGALQGRLI